MAVLTWRELEPGATLLRGLNVGDCWVLVRVSRRGHHDVDTNTWLDLCDGRLLTTSAPDTLAPGAKQAAKKA